MGRPVIRTNNIYSQRQIEDFFAVCDTIYEIHILQKGEGTLLSDTGHYVFPAELV